MTTFRERLAKRLNVTEHLGVWNASTNSPTLTSGVGQTNGYYIVSTGGSTLLDGESDWKVGDWVYFTGTAWEKIDNTEDLGSSNNVGSIAYVSSIEQIEVIPADNGSMQQGISFNVNFSQPVPVIGDLYLLPTTIDSFPQSVNDLLNYRDRFRITPETNQVSCLFTGVMPDPLVANYLIFVPVMDLGGGVQIKSPDLIFKLATLTPQSLNFPDIFESSNYVPSYLELELNSSDITSALYYKRSSQDLSSLQSNLEPRLTTVETELTSIEDSISNKLNTTGGTLTGPVTTLSHIFLYGGSSNDSLAAVNKETVQNMLSSYVPLSSSNSFLQTPLQASIDGNQKNITNLNSVQTNEINLTSGSTTYLNGEHVIYNNNFSRNLIKLQTNYAPGSVTSWSEVLHIAPSFDNTSYFTKLDSSLSVKKQTISPNLITFYDTSGTQQGTITMSGSTVFYGDFCGAHTSQLQQETDETKLGTVMESIDELCQWSDASTETRLPKVKVSNLEESSSVYGVYNGKDKDGDILVASVGLFYCRIAPDIVVKKGDLLVSNGDGCARVQSDDIIRSKTIGKVVSATVAHSYEDGSYTVPVALYCG